MFSGDKINFTEVSSHLLTPVLMITHAQKTDLVLVSIPIPSKIADIGPYQYRY